MIDIQYYKNLPRKYMGAGVLFFDKEHRVLLVKPTYKNHWEIPGGVVELNESLKSAADREIKEELSLDVDVSELLCVDWCANQPEKGDSLQFIFSGGEVTDAQISQIKLPGEELSDFRF